MLVSDKLIQAIKKFEGCRLEAYQDAAGVWTIGYGHTKNVCRGDKISLYAAEEYLKQDVHEAELLLLGAYSPKTIGQLDSLVDFVFNLGLVRFKKSTLFKCLKEGRGKSTITLQFLRWVYVGGRVLNGLVKRRNWEVKRYFEKSRELTQDDIMMYLEEGYA